MPDPMYLRWQEAIDCITNEPNRTTRRLLRRLLGAHAQHHVHQDIGPCAPVDMLYVVKLARSVFQAHEALRAVLDGGDADEWFDDDEY